MKSRDDIPKDLTEKIINSLTSRKGFDNWWDGIDDEIQEEITEEIQTIIIKELSIILSF